MDTIQRIFAFMYDIANMPINLFGYNITFWNVILFVMFGGLLIAFVKKLFN